MENKTLIIVITILIAIGVLWGIIMENVTQSKSNDEKGGGLDESCEQYIGSLLSIKPIYGWGWHGNKEEPDAPEEFNTRLERLFWSERENIRRGGVGKVESPGHIYDNHTIIFDIRNYGDYNFTDKIGAYNIIITKSELYEKEGWPLPLDPKNGCAGYCEIRAVKVKE